MPKTSRKRKSCENMLNTAKYKKKAVKTVKDVIEDEKEILAEINNNITIIRLDENINIQEDAEDDNDDDNDSDWEDVSDIEDKPDIIVNLKAEEFDLFSKKRDEIREQQKLAREKRELIHRTILMSLICRAIFINRLCDIELMKNLAWSFVGSTKKNCNEMELREFVIDMLNQFEVIPENNESGLVEEILVQAFHTRKVSQIWINVLLAIILRSSGINTRLLAIFYPIPLKKTGKSAQQGILIREEILCPPTKHKPSTRGRSKGIKGAKVKNKFSFDIPTSSDLCSIVFFLELLDCHARKWIPVDAQDLNSWNDISTIVQRYPRFLYCLAVHQDGIMKDVAPKYDITWATSSRRQRLPDTSLMRIIKLFTDNQKTPEDQNENVEIRNRLMEQGVPQTLTDLKGHPLFVLKSHMLKYEVLYPPDVAPYGWYRKEEVYLRDNVAVAHTKETWLKEAMAIKAGEQSCKKVKTLCSRRKHSELGTDPFVDLFGPWQVEDYTPPVAQDGIVPRNTFGNVDLFKSSMLPQGCSHLRLSDLDKIANNLEIDCAPAMVGWAFSKRNISRPVYDGWVVCKEHVKVLHSAWLECALLKQKKQTEQREKRIIKRWEILTRRLLLKERLKKDYNF